MDLLAKKGSDLFITAGFPPALKIDGKISPVSKNALTPQHTVELVRSEFAEHDDLLLVSQTGSILATVANCPAAPQSGVVVTSSQNLRSFSKRAPIGPQGIGDHVRILPTPGHTPGHVAFTFGSGINADDARLNDGALRCWGDNGAGQL